MANYNDTPINEFIRAWETAWVRAGEEADALFESGEPSDAELEIISDSQLASPRKW